MARERTTVTVIVCHLRIQNLQLRLMRRRLLDGDCHHGVEGGALGRDSEAPHIAVRIHGVGELGLGGGGSGRSLSDGRAAPASGVSCGQQPQAFES